MATLDPHGSVGSRRTAGHSRILHLVSLQVATVAVPCGTRGHYRLIAGWTTVCTSDFFVGLQVASIKGQHNFSFWEWMNR